MNQLTFLLYILSEVLSQANPQIFKEDLLEQLCTPNITVESFLSLANLNRKQSSKFYSVLNNSSKADYQKELADHKIQAINFLEPHYPKLLKEVLDRPLILYVRGSLPENKINLAMIGSRRKTHYGVKACKQILKTLSQQNISIISGLAYGIDAECHTEALANDLHTTAVLATGLDDQSLYPKENYHLAQKILSTGGALVSEYPPHTPALPFRFVARNRIIAGLSDAVLVIECAEKSGALITTDFALDYNREVYAVAGDIFLSQSAGPNKLIKQGASIITKPEDILGYLNLYPVNSPANYQLSFSDEEQTVLKCMQTESISFESLMFKTGFQSHQLQSLLSLLEIKGVLTQIGHQQYQKSNA